MHSVVYSIIFALYVIAWINDTKLFNEKKYAPMGFPFDDSFGRRLKFLTYLNMVNTTKDAKNSIANH